MSTAKKQNEINLYLKVLVIKKPKSLNEFDQILWHAECFGKFGGHLIPIQKRKKCFIDNIQSLLLFYKDPHRADMALQIIMITFIKSVNQNSIKPCQK